MPARWECGSLGRRLLSFLAMMSVSVLGDAEPFNMTRSLFLNADCTSSPPSSSSANDYNGTFVNGLCAALSPTSSILIICTAKTGGSAWNVSEYDQRSDCTGHFVSFRGSSETTCQPSSLSPYQSQKIWCGRD